jgi:hypothetical protein
MFLIVAHIGDFTPEGQRPMSELDDDLKTALLRNVTVSIVTGGAAIGLKRKASYVAAQEGRLPTIQVGRRKRRVPTAPLCELLGLKQTAT